MAFRSIREHRQRFGLRKTLAELADRAVNKCTTCVGLEAMTLTLASVDETYFDDDLSYRFLDDDEVRRFAADDRNEMTAAFVEDVLGKGDRCFGCLDGDQLASYGWYGNDASAVTDDLVVEFDANWMYMSKGFTRHEYRGRRLHAIGMANALRAVTADGSPGLISVVETTNFASLRSCERLGYVIFGRSRAMRIGRRYVIRNSRSCERYGFRLRERTLQDRAVPAIDPT